MQKTLLVCLLVGLFLLATIFFPVPVHAQVGVSPNSQDFGSVVLSAKSSAATVVVTNQSGSYDAILRISSSLPEFVVTSPALPITLAPFGSASFQVIFAPDSARSFSGSVVFSSRRTNGSGSSIAVSGIGIIPPTHLVSASPINLNFGSSLVGYPVAETIALTNTGTASVTLSQATIAGAGFFVSGLSGAVTLAAGQGMTQALLTGTGFSMTRLATPLTVSPGATSNFTLSFAPFSSGTLSGSLLLVSNAPVSPLVVSLVGTGVASVLQLTASPTSLNFGSLVPGTSATQNVTLTNTGNSSVTTSQISTSGAGFTVNSVALPFTLAAAQSSTFTAAFAPATTETLSGAVTVSSTATNSPQIIALSGTGTAPVTHTVDLTWTASSSTYSDLTCTVR